MRLVALAVLLASCAGDIQTWPSGARSSVEGRWCQGTCDDIALLTDELLEWEGRQTRYIFVWTQESWPQLSSPGYHVGYFFELAPGEFHDGISTHVPTDLMFDHHPTFDDVVMARR